MKDLNKKVLGGLIRLITTLAALLLLPAWTLGYWQAWVFLVVFSSLVAAIAFISIFIFSAIDHRFAWSDMPVYVVVTGDLLVAIGLIIVFFVFRENSFASATIEIGDEQKLISTGPYAIVRHPMYIGGGFSMKKYFFQKICRAILPI